MNLCTQSSSSSYCTLIASIAAKTSSSTKCKKLHPISKSIPIRHRAWHFRRRRHNCRRRRRRHRFVVAVVAVVIVVAVAVVVVVVVVVCCCCCFPCSCSCCSCFCCCSSSCSCCHCCYYLPPSLLFSWLFRCVSFA